MIYNDTYGACFYEHCHIYGNNENLHKGKHLIHVFAISKRESLFGLAN